jgi:VWFA-related protein
MDRERLFPLLIICLLAVSPTIAQNENAATDQQPNFKSNVHVVLIDVVVTSSKDEPVTGLTKDQFQVFEDGKPQAVGSFEEHAGIPDVPELTRMAKLPPNVFSNAPLVKSGDAVNILLLDSLNTQMWDQSYVHAQMIKYIKDVRPRTRLAVFTLSDRLRFVQGFTEDPALLMAAVNGKNGAGNAELSSDLQADSERNANQLLVGQMRAMGVSTGARDIQAAANSLAAFMAENTRSQNGERASLTLEAIDQLAMYLQAIPGRKNVIWFTGSFPLNTLSTDPNMLRDYGPEVAKTANLLAAARVAIYPVGVGAMGLSPNAIYDSSIPAGATGITGANFATQYQTQSLDTESTERLQNSASLEELAKNTGGQSFTKTNGINDALDHVIKDGAYYYTLTYSPANKKMDGQLRRIEIKLTDGKYKLAYRRGYYATNDFMSPASKTPPKGDPLKPLMQHGSLDSTAILYTMKVVEAATQPGTLEPGDHNKPRDSVTRFAADFVVPLENLDFDITSDGVRHGNVELALVAYDHDGHALNWLFRSITTSLKPEVYPAVLKTGAVFHQEIDVPPGANYLRAGIYDLRSNQAGTLEIPLSEVQAAGVADVDSTSTQKPPAVAPSPAPLTSGSTSQPMTVAKSSATTNPNGANSLSMATASETTHPVPQSSSSPLQQSNQDAKKGEIIDIPVYCAQLAQKVEHSSALANVCRFALFTIKRFPDLICDREMRSHWIEFRPHSAGDPVPVYAETSNAPPFSMISHSDLLTAQVTYRNGQEYYDHLLLNGQPISSESSALPPPSLRGPWSVGEFGVILQSIFLPASKAEFQFKKQTHIGSAKALLFTFRVAAANNRYFYLFAGDKKWFPQYRGELWIDEDGFHLLRLERETGRMADYPIRSLKTTIQYAQVSLADGSTLVLPSRSEVNTCTPPGDYCSSSLVTFTEWHTFKATSTIVNNPEH